MADPVIGVPGWHWSRWDFDGKASVEIVDDQWNRSVSLGADDDLCIEHDDSDSLTCRVHVPLRALVALLEAHGLTVVPIAAPGDGKKGRGA